MAALLAAWQRISISAVLATISVGGLSWVSGIHELQERLSKKIEFVSRDFLNQHPQVSPRLKVIGVDNESIRSFGSLAKIQPGDWISVLRSVAAEKPQAIIFDATLETPNLSEETARSMKVSPDFLDVPIYFGAVVLEKELSSMKNLLQDSHFLTYSGETSLPVRPHKQRLVLSSGASILAISNGVGAMNHSGQGTFQPAFVWDNGTFIPHLGIRASQNISLSKDGVQVDGRSIPLDSRGRLTANIMADKTLREIYIPFHSIHKSAYIGKKAEKINKGDVVVIIPGLFPQSGDVVDTPVGPMYGGTLILAIANSVLTGQWIHPLGDGAIARLIIILAAGTLAACLFILAPIGRSLRWVSLFSVAIATAGIGLFAFFGFDVPWSYGLLSAVVASAAMNFLKDTGHSPIASKNGETHMAAAGENL